MIAIETSSSTSVKPRRDIARVAECMTDNYQTNAGCLRANRHYRAPLHSSSTHAQPLGKRDLCLDTLIPPEVLTS